ncbi:MAG: hypothetical protein ABIG34_01420 [Candidatus Peregrinibacteria bacterium]
MLEVQRSDHPVTEERHKAASTEQNKERRAAIARCVEEFRPLLNFAAGVRAHCS